MVERSPGLRDGGYMLGLSDPGLDAAERMGVADALRAARHMPRRLTYLARLTLGLIHSDIRRLWPLVALDHDNIPNRDTCTQPLRGGVFG